jgi:hypothetical protein
MVRMQSQVVKAVQTFVPKFGTLQHGIVDVQQLDKLVTLVTAIAEHQVQLDQRLDKLENLLTIRTSVYAAAAANSPVASVDVTVFPAANVVPATTNSAGLLQARTEALTAPTPRHPISSSTPPVDLKPPVDRSQPDSEPGEDSGYRGSAMTFFLSTQCGRKVEQGEMKFKSPEQKRRALLCCRWFKAIATQVI